MNKLVLLALVGAFFIPLLSDAHAANPNLYVSAENPAFNNRFAGSMVIEVVVSDPSMSDLSEAKGEPDVTINGNTLRMVQATDGKWYGYFANVDKAKEADQTAQSGASGKGLDFGVFCSRDTSSLGVSFTETDGIAVPRATTGATNGNAGFGTCTGTPSGAIINNVVRYPRSINTNPAVQTGQIGLDEDAWPIIQLYSFSGDVTILYNAGGGAQQVRLQYDDIPNISLELDRAAYPPNSEVFVTVRDAQLNQDPTARDSWTFNTGSPEAVFYAAFTENGNDAANNSLGLVNLRSSLSDLGFEKNGILTMNTGSVLDLKSNGFQSETASDTSTTYQNIVTLVETQPNSGIFETGDHNDRSSVSVLSSAPRGQSATIQYNSKTTSILSGLGTAGISLGAQQVVSGQKVAVTVNDPDQNVNNGVRDRLEVFRSTAIIPSLTIGSPITLQNAASVKFHTNSGDSITATGTSVSSSVPDTRSDRLVLDTTSVVPDPLNFDKISMNLGVTATQLQSLLIDTSDGDMGTNWINYDLRSLERQLGISNFADTSIQLFFPSDSSTVTLASAGSVSSQGFSQISSAAVSQIASKSGQVYLVINFDASDNTASAMGTATGEDDKQPIVFDIFSFGQKDNADVNNAIYRFELRESSTSSGTFAGTLEYVIANQLNQFDANTISGLRTINEDVKFFVNQRLVDEKGISIAYSDIDEVGVTTGTSSKTDIRTHSGAVSLNSKTFRFGSPVTVVVVDPDLNLDHDSVDIYSVINDPGSDDVDTVGSSGGMLLEVLIKDVRYKRCTINGVEYGGLAASGFSLIETGPNTGRFEGTFKMPSQICNRDGTKLISPAGGIVDLKYHDFRDALGQENIFTLSKSGSSAKEPTAPKPPAKEPATKTPPTTKTPTKTPAVSKTKTFELPSYGMKKDLILSGKVKNYTPGTKIQFLLTAPDGKATNLEAFATTQGKYRTIITLKSDSPTGKYSIDISYMESKVGKLTFDVIKSSKSR